MERNKYYKKYYHLKRQLFAKPQKTYYICHKISILGL